MATAEPILLSDYVTLKQGAAIAGMKYHAFRAAIDRGRIRQEHTTRIGWVRLVKRSAVETFRETNRK